MAKYRGNLPQLDGGLFLTDAGIETTLVFHEGQELPYFAAFHLLKTSRGTDLLRHYFRHRAHLHRSPTEDRNIDTHFRSTTLHFPHAVIMHNDSDTPPANRQRHSVAAATAVLYLTAVVGYAAWQGEQLWGGKSFWFILAIPGVAALSVLWPAGFRALRNRIASVTILYLIVVPMIAMLTFGGIGLTSAYLVAEAIGEWPNRVVRTSVSVALMLLLSGITAVAYRTERSQISEPR